MAVQIKVEFEHEVRSYGGNYGWSFYVLDVNSPLYHLGGECQWAYLGRVGLYYPEIWGGENAPFILCPNRLPNGISFPQSYARNLHAAAVYFDAMAETYLALSEVEADRREWAVKVEVEQAMARAELAESLGLDD